MLNQENELPPGFIFDPKPLELINLLFRKLLGYFSSYRIKDLDDVYQFDPDQLPLDSSPEMRPHVKYFFAPKENINLQRRETPNGYWQILKENVPVYNFRRQIVGLKNELSFYSNGIETDWMMSEYRCNIDSNGSVKNKYVVCKIEFKVDEPVLFYENVDETFDDFTEEEEDNVA